MRKPGVLLYKCRRCGKVSEDTHSPDAIPTLVHLLYDAPLPKHWGDSNPVSKENICICDDGSYGVSDVIGFSVDSKRVGI